MLLYLYLDKYIYSHTKGLEKIDKNDRSFAKISELLVNF